MFSGRFGISGRGCHPAFTQFSETSARQVWMIVPEVFVENRHSGKVEDMRLSFA
jgi:hypothetical protein